MTVFDVMHFNRPYWLLLIPLIALLLSAFKLRVNNNAVKNIVAEHLLPFIVRNQPQHPAWRLFGVTSILLFVLGLAGIGFHKTESELFSATQKTVFIVDQSLSMYATDLQPNRLTKTKQIIRDILDTDLEGELALVAYAGEAYVISPFTQDKQTLTHLLVALDPLIMPLYGSNLSDAIDTAIQLIPSNQVKNSRFVILTDDIEKESQQALLNAHNLGIQMHIISIGTEKGDLIKLPDGQTFMHNGIYVKPKTPVAELKKLANDTHGYFYDHTVSPEALSNISLLEGQSVAAKKSNVKGVVWDEQGHWFALPFLVWLLMQFRSYCFVLALVVTISSPKPAFASPLDWFKTNDQKAQQAVDNGNWPQAKLLFENKKWKAASLYATEDYKEAAETLAPLAKSASDFYNLGNSLALSEQLEAAAQAFEQALKLAPDFSEAKANLEYIQSLLEKAAEQNKQNNGQDSQKDEKDSSSEKNNSQQQKNNPNDEPDNASQKQDNTLKNQDNKSKPSASEENQAEQNSQRTEQEDQRALDQWLRQIQDDPGTLMQRKLWYLHQERRNQNRYNLEEGQQPW